MGLKHVQLQFVVLTILLAVSVSSVAGNIATCIKACRLQCKGEPDFDQCVRGCAWACGPRTTTVSDPSYFCDLGCSLQKCATIDADDEKEVGRCLDECSTVYCKLA